MSLPSQFKRILSIRFDRSRIDSLDSLVEFIHTRAAYIAQTSLYGYLKTRMGTQYRVIFEDESFADPLNAAKWRTYAACLDDLTVFAIATVVRDGQLGAGEAAACAYHCLRSALQSTFGGCHLPNLQTDTLARFSQRVAPIDWSTAAKRENAFTTSPRVLVEAAPVADEFKMLDREIVSNSIRFRWRDVRTQLRKRLCAEAIIAEWRDCQNSVIS